MSGSRTRDFAIIGSDYLPIRQSSYAMVECMRDERDVSGVCRAGLTGRPGHSATPRRPLTRRKTKTPTTNTPRRRTRTTAIARLLTAATTMTPSCTPTFRLPPARRRRRRSTSDTCGCWTGRPGVAVLTTRRLC